MKRILVAKLVCAVAGLVMLTVPAMADKKQSQNTGKKHGSLPVTRYQPETGPK